MLSSLAGPAMAGPLDAMGLDQAEFSRLGLGLRFEFGGPESAVSGSLAVTSTGQMRQREITVPLASVDLSGQRLRLGTLLGLRLRTRALRHDVRLLELPAAYHP